MAFIGIVVQAGDVYNEFTRGLRIYMSSMGAAFASNRGNSASCQWTVAIELRIRSRIAFANAHVDFHNFERSPPLPAPLLNLLAPATLSAPTTGSPLSNSNFSASSIDCVSKAAL